ncbi:MAG: aminotransferase class V-fold PLP-dependent enzyme, partial [Candidatus Woesearchaeota archaeon]
HGGSGSDSELKDMPDYLPTKYEAGSPNIHAISGLNAALKWLDKTGVNKIYKHKKELTEKLIKELNEFFDIKLYLPDDLDKHIGIVSAKFSSQSPTEINKIFNENYNISVRTGLHCSPEIHKFLGSYPEGLVRFSLGYFNTFDQIEVLKDSLNEFII